MGIVLAVRDDGEASELAGPPTVQIKGIDARESLALLGSIWPGRLDDDIVHRVVAESRGNPLALREFSEAMMAAHTRGEYDVPAGGSLASRIERSFLTRLQVLPADTLQLLLTAAAEPVGDASLLWGAAEHLGVTADALSPAVVADGAGITTPPTREIVGADFVLASLAHLRDALAVDSLGAASVNATPGIVMRADDRVVAVLVFNVVEGLISRVWVIANPARLTRWNQGEDDS